MTVRRFWRAFLDGLANLYCWGDMSPYEIPGYRHKSESEALASDWRAIAADLRKAEEDLRKEIVSR